MYSGRLRRGRRGGGWLLSREGGGRMLRVRWERWRAGLYSDAGIWVLRPSVSMKISVHRRRGEDQTPGSELGSGRGDILHFEFIRSIRDCGVAFVATYLREKTLRVSKSGLLRARRAW